ncbi:D-alanyl-D-alanine carboxypeptidase family protein [Marinobacteraceae bacterium S3BR75-40.1]
MTKSRFHSLWLSFVLLLSSSLALAAQPALIPAPPQIAASSYILMDARSGKILVEKNSDESLPPASLTKLMTAYIAERELADGRIKMDDMVPISVHAWKTGGSRMFIREGTRVSVEDLLHGIIIQSGNDASVALAEYIAGSEDAFADIMNQQAKLLGMNHTHFVNATGLPHENHYTSAHDLALLARAIIEDYPDNYAIYAQKYFTYNDIRQPNRNSLLWRDKSVDGLKTGHTEEAGYCLVASAKRDGMRLISVVMGTNSEQARAQESQKLLNYGFRYYETRPLYTAGQSLMESEVWGGKKDKFSLGVLKDIVVTVPQGSASQMDSTLDVQSVIEAPVAEGNEYGRLKVTLGEETIVNQPLVALEPVEEAGFFKRLWDMIVLFFMQLFA